MNLIKQSTERLRSLIDFLFGYDFFISYAHADGMFYPQQLADRLQERGFTVFLDKRVYVAGDDLRRATRRRIRMSRKLVVIARPRAMESDWVQRELQVCIAAKRIPILIDVNQTFARAPAEHIVKKMLEDNLFIPEHLASLDGEPSEDTLQELQKSFAATRQESLRLRFVSLSAIIFLAVAVIAAWQWRVAVDEKLNAIYAAGEFERYCREAVRQVNAGQDKINQLKKSSLFGELIGAIAEEMANLPETAKINCDEVGQRPDDWRPPEESKH
jgi:DNA-binding FrmR family transcriptional regulator